MTQGFRPEDYATTDQLFGWMSAQAHSMAHLWAFQMIQAGQSPEQARQHFNALLRQMDNGGHAIGSDGAESSLNIHHASLSHAEEIYDRAVGFMEDHYGGGG